MDGLTKEQIRYRDGFKYQLEEDSSIFIPELAEYNVEIGFVSLSSGLLTVRAGFAWDGPSGPTFDTPSFMRGSLFHDALYYLMKKTPLPWSFRGLVDKLLIRVCKADGMPVWRRAYVWSAVHIFGKMYSESNKDAVLTAP